MFESAKLKVERAEQHIAYLQRTFKAFVETNNYNLSVSEDPKTSRTTIKVHFSDYRPQEFALVIGDAVHNLRTALDHATWELIGLDSGTRDRYTTFPTGDDKVNYEASCNGIKTPRGDTKKFFIALAAYKSGPGVGLYTIHRLDITDKHTILIPSIHVALLKNVKLRHKEGGSITIGQADVNLGPNGEVFVVKTPAGAALEIDKEAKASFGIIFGEIEHLKFQPVIPTLMLLRDVISDTLGQFQLFVDKRV